MCASIGRIPQSELGSKKHFRRHTSFRIAVLLKCLHATPNGAQNILWAIMRYAVSASAGTVVWAALLACYLQAGCSMAVSGSDPSLSKSGDDSNQQIESGMSKRDWQKSLPLWGKRAWQNLQGGWGKRDGWGNGPLYSLSSDKRAWQNLQGGWGKRYAPEDEYAMRQLSAILEQEDQEPQYPEYGNDADVEANEDDKRAWKSLNGGGWGKRSDWSNFRGSWGKRDPAWTNLKGIWGKRSYPDRISQ